MGAADVHAGHAPPDWPIFPNATALVANASWRAYFLALYGEVPQSGYPISIADFQLLYSTPLTKAGIVLPSAPACPLTGRAGELYTTGTTYWRSDDVLLFQPWRKYAALINETWVEVCHQGGSAASDEGHGAWFYLCKGSGVWFNLGRTAAFSAAAPAYAQQLHELAYIHFLGPDPSAWSNERMAIKAAELGYTSIQFVGVVDPGACERPGNASAVQPLQTEIVGVRLNGTKVCPEPWTGRSGRAIRAGWQASRACDCNESEAGGFINCVGVPTRTAW